MEAEFSALQVWACCPRLGQHRWGSLREYTHWLFYRIPQLRWWENLCSTRFVEKILVLMPKARLKPAFAGLWLCFLCLLLKNLVI